VVKLIVASDFHLDASTAGMPRYDDVTKACDEIVQTAVKVEANMFLFLGDLTDPDSVRSHRAVAYGIGLALRLAPFGIASRWLVGNHDVIEDGSGDSTLMAITVVGAGMYDEFCRVYASPTSEWIADDILLVALPFTARSHPYDPSDFVSKVDFDDGNRAGNRVVVIGHLNLEGIGPGSEVTDMPRGRDVFFPVDAVQKRWPGALMLNGHIHKRQRFNGVYIPGAPCRFTFGEEHNSPSYIVCEV